MTDVIDRKEAVRIARSYCHPENIARELERMPSAQKTGRWVPDPAWRWVHLYACSECGWSHSMDYNRPDWKYCPMCGAEMEDNAE